MITRCPAARMERSRRHLDFSTEWEHSTVARKLAAWTAQLGILMTRAIGPGLSLNRCLLTGKVSIQCCCAGSGAGTPDRLGYLYNLDPTVTDAVIVTATQVDGGAYCPINAAGPFTGRVGIGAGAFSSAPLVLP